MSMRIVNRALGTVLAVLLILLSGLVIIEVMASYFTSSPLLVDYRPLLDWADRTTWATRSVQIGSIVTALVGLGWLVLELRPSEPVRLKARSDDPAVTVTYSRRSVQDAVDTGVGTVDAVRSVRTVVRGKAIRVLANTGETGETASQLRAPVSESVERTLRELDLEREPRTAIKITPRKS